MTTLADQLSGWYHTMKLPDGSVTKGHKFEDSWAQIEALQDSVDFRGKRVLDIGAMDGKFSFRAESKGAADVLAIDSIRNPRLEWAKSVFRSRISICRASVEHLRSDVPGWFDIVQFFGVFYHLQNPCLALPQIRSVVKPTGVVLFETGAINAGHEAPIMQFNRGVQVYDDDSTYWLPNMKCLELLLPMYGLKIETSTITRLQQGYGERIAFVCHPV